VDHITDLVGQLHRVKNLIHGCESLSVASIDGLVMATTHDEPRKADFVAAVTSLLLTNSASLLAPLKAGECRALDARRERPVHQRQRADPANLKPGESLGVLVRRHPDGFGFDRAREQSKVKLVRAGDHHE
jgi:hypothetical protein